MLVIIVLVSGKSLRVRDDNLSYSRRDYSKTSRGAVGAPPVQIRVKAGYVYTSRHYLFGLKQKGRDAH